jgi:alpha-glucosidase
MNGVSLSETSRLDWLVSRNLQTDLHLFSPSQPDLNWDTPAVREELCDTVRFWGDRGTDGFRVSVMLFATEVI